MRRTTIAAGIAAAAITGTALAVPALADTASTTPTASVSASQSAGTSSGGLTPAQQQELDDFLAAHPKVAQALVARIEQWKTFADAHPDLVAELKKVAQLPADQRRTELTTWLKAHPDDAKAWHAFRKQVRDARKERRDQRRERRHERRGGGTGSSSSPSSTSGSPAAPSSTTAG